MALKKRQRNLLLSCQKASSPTKLYRLKENESWGGRRQTVYQYIIITITTCYLLFASPTCVCANVFYWRCVCVGDINEARGTYY